MPILYSVISRGTTVLAKYAECVGNFAEVTEQVMVKIKAENHKLTYTHGDYLIQYICEDRIVYMCITDNVSPQELAIECLRCDALLNLCFGLQEFERARAFLFLNAIKRKFIETYGLQAATALGYAMNTEFSQVMAVQQRHYSESKDKITAVAGQVEEMREIMIKNIGELGQRLFID